MSGEKKFGEWIGVKSELHFGEACHTVNDGDIWWAGVGENVGVEINGKSALFSRPVLVLKKLSRWGFMGIPLTSQRHAGSWYVEFVFKSRVEVAVLAQARVLSVSRLYKKIGQLPQSDLENVWKGFLDLYRP